MSLRHIHRDTLIYTDRIREYQREIHWYHMWSMLGIVHYMRSQGFDVTALRNRWLLH